MGILRADRITGLGGANAITGSTSFGGSGNHLNVEGIDDDFVTWWTADFTIEAWVFIDNFASWMFDDGNHFPAMVGHMSATTNTNYWSFGPAENNSTNTLEFYYWKGSQNHTFVHTATIKENEWTHIAMSFSTSNGAKLFINGTGTSYISLSGTPQVSSSAAPFVVGQYNNQTVSGNISNLRIIKGTALYTSDFTPPTNRLEKTSNTKLLICNSASDVTHNDDEKIITPVRSSTNNTGPVASRFTPNSPVGFSTTTDVGSQYGTTFDGFGSFATSTYMVPPGGNTRERNRGRAVFGGGESPTADNVMEYINIQSGGRTFDFGDHSAGNTPSGDAVASSTRGVFTVHASPNTNALEFITIANTGNSQDFGDQTTGGVSQEAAASNSTRGLFAGGIFPGSQVHATTEYITIAALGNATNFGNLIAAVTSNTGVADATRALFAGGIGPSSPFPTVNRIEYFTIANTGNATDFGDLTFSARYPSSAGDSTRGVFMGGATPSAINTICFVTIQTTGDATDYGDLVTASHDIAATSNNTRAIMGGGGTPSRTNTIEQLTIQTTGNATDFGDLSRKVDQLGVCSDSHGGL